MVEYEEKLHKVAAVIREGIHFDCECEKCVYLRSLLDYLVGVEDRLPEPEQEQKPEKEGCGEKQFERIEFDEWFVCGEYNDYLREIYYCDKCKEKK